MEEKKRAKKPPERRQVRFQIALLQSQIEEIEALAQASGLDRTAYIRVILLQAIKSKTKVNVSI